MCVGKEMESPVCEICVVEFDDEVVPKILKECGHTFCNRCITRLLDCYTPRPGEFAPIHPCVRCPYDEKVTLVLKGNSNRLPSNFALISLIEEVKSQKILQQRALTLINPVYTAEAAPAPPPRPVSVQSPFHNERCHENPEHEAAVHCSDCRANLCFECCTQIHTLQIFKNHDLKEISAINENNCPIHRDQDVLYNCRSSFCSANHSYGCMKCFDLDGEHAFHGCIIRIVPLESYPHSFLFSPRSSFAPRYVSSGNGKTADVDRSPAAAPPVTRPLFPDLFDRAITPARMDSLHPADPHPRRRHGRLRRLFNRLF